MPNTTANRLGLSATVTLAAILLSIGLSVRPLSAQTTNPNVVEFIPPAEHTALLSTGQPVISRYDLVFYQAGAVDGFMVVNLGKPARQADGLARVDFDTLFAAWPLPGVSSEARVFAIGPNGTAASATSNTFVYTCTPRLAATMQSFAAAGGSGSVGLSTGTHCGWTAASSASWVTVTSPASGVGSTTISYAVSPNSSTTSRTATLTAGGLAYTVSQGGVSSTSPAANVAPTVSLTEPTAGAVIKGGPPFRISAHATDSDGTVTRVEFYANGALIRTLTAAPFTFKWKASGRGTVALQAVARDNAGATATSATVNITVR